jgi:hypothetical protein
MFADPGADFLPDDGYYRGAAGVCQKHSESTREAVPKHFLATSGESG